MEFEVCELVQCFLKLRIFLFKNHASNLDLRYLFYESELSLFLLTLKLSRFTSALTSKHHYFEKTLGSSVLAVIFQQNLCIDIMVEVFFAGAGKQISRLYHVHLLLWIWDCFPWYFSFYTEHILYPSPGLY